MRDVLITGAGRGLGIHLVRFCLERGDRVFAGCRKVSAGLAALLRSRPDRLEVVRMDVASESSVRSAARSIARMSEHLDVVVNNAAIFEKKYESLPLEKVDLKSAERTIRVNGLGPLSVLKHFSRLLGKTGGLIINISSEAGSIGQSGRVDNFGYCMSKAALNMLTKLSWNYLKEKKIRMLAVHPGWLRTDMGGPAATDDPAVSAAEIFRLADGPASDGKHLYWDHTGKKMEW